MHVWFRQFSLNIFGPWLAESAVQNLGMQRSGCKSPKIAKYSAALNPPTRWRATAAFFIPGRGSQCFMSRTDFSLCYAFSSQLVFRVCQFCFKNMSQLGVPTSPQKSLSYFGPCPPEPLQRPPNGTWLWPLVTTHHPPWPCKKCHSETQIWWPMPITPVLRRQKQ